MNKLRTLFRTLTKNPQKISIFELLLWMTIISAALSQRERLGSSFVAVVFYGTIAAISWRLSFFVPVRLAIVIGLVCGFGLTAFYLWFEI